MEISITCSHCNQALAVDEELAGQIVSCPGCQQPVEVPRRKIRLRRPESPPPSSATKPCSHCGVALQMEAVICVQCGWDLRANRPLRTSVKKNGQPTGWGRKVAVLVCLAVIVGSGWQIWQHVRLRIQPLGRPPTGTPAVVEKISQVAQEWTGTEPEEPDGEVVRWDVSATVERGATNAVAWGGWRTIIPPDRLPPLRPMVRVTVQTKMRGTLLPLWPRATRIQLLRADSPQETGRVLTEIKGNDLQLLRGQALSPGQAQFFLRDRAPESGRRHFYWIRFLGQRGKELARSGYCSATVFELPAWEWLDTNAVPATIRWSGWPGLPPTNAFLFVELEGAHELGRWPVRAGEFRCPLPLLVNNQPTPLAFGIGLSVTADYWSSSVGQLRRTENIRSTDRIAVKRPDLKIGQSPGAKPETLQFIAKPDTGEVTLLNNLHDILAVANSEVVTPSGGRQSSSWAPLQVGLPAGISEKHEFSFGWKELVSVTEPIPNGTRTTRSQGSVIATARVSVVRSPLPHGLRAVPGNGEVRLTWEPLLYRPEDWVTPPQFVLLRGEAGEVQRESGQLTTRPTHEIFRGDTTITNFVDRTVTNNGVYFYALAVEGATRAQGWWRDVGNYECILPVSVRSDSASRLPPVFAVPGPMGPVTLLLAAAADEARVLPPLLAAVASRAAATGWLQLATATDGSPVLPGPAMSGASLTARIEQAAETDGQLQFAMWQLRNAIYLDVWLDRPGSGQRERLLSLPLTKPNPDAIAAAVIERLTDKFRDSARATTPLPSAESRRATLRRLATPEPPPEPAGTDQPTTWEQARSLAATGATAQAAALYAQIPHSFPALLAATRLLPSLPAADQLPVLRALWENHREPDCNREPLVAAMLALAPDGTNGLQATAVISSAEKAQQIKDAQAAMREDVRRRIGAARPAEPAAKPNAMVERTTGGRMFQFHEDGLVIALDPATKAVQWQYPLQPRTPYKSGATTLMSWRGAGVQHFVHDLDVLANSFLLTAQTLFVTDPRGGKLHALDVESGARRWVFADWTMISAPVLADGRLFIGNAFGDLVELDLPTGEVRRRITHPVELETWVACASLPLIFPADNGRSLAFADLSPRAPAHLPGSWPVTHTVALADGRVTFTVRKAEPPPAPASPAPIAATAKLPTFTPLKYSDAGYQEVVRNVYSFLSYPGPMHPEEHRIVADVRETFLRCQQGDSTAREHFRDMLQMKNGTSPLDTSLAAGVVARWYCEPEFVPLLMKMTVAGGHKALVGTVCHALGSLGDRQAIPALIRSLPESGGDLSSTGLVLPPLERLTGYSLGPTRNVWECWWRMRGEAELLPPAP